MAAVTAEKPGRDSERRQERWRSTAEPTQSPRALGLSRRATAMAEPGAAHAAREAACYLLVVATKKKNGGKAGLTTEILVQIRDELRRTRQDLSSELQDVKGALQVTNERLDRLERRQTEDAVRLATELVAVADAVGQVRDLLREQRAERNRLDDHERRIAALEAKRA